MFAGIDVASERRMLARLDDTGAPIGKPMPITEDRAGFDMLLKALRPPPALIVMKATVYYWKNVFAVLVAAGHEVALLNQFVARRFQDSSLERTKTDAIDAHGLPSVGYSTCFASGTLANSARLAFEKRPEST